MSNDLKIGAQWISLPVLLAIYSTSVAQGASPPQGHADSGGALGEVVVTAQKRSEPLVDVPISMAVIGDQEMRAANALTLSDISMSVPDLTFDSQDGKLAGVYIRGVGSDSRNIGFDTRVGVYLDGVYIGQSSQLDQELVGIDRIEILRGPQGTLFGKNTDAGAINIITQRPSMSLDGFVAADFGNYDERTYTGKINVPTGADSAFSLAVSNTRRNGFIDNIYDGADLENRDRTQVRAQFLYTPIDKLQIYLTTDYFAAHELNQQPSPITNTFGNAPPAYDAKFYNADFNFLPTLDRINYGSSADVSYEFDDGIQIRSISAYRNTQEVGRNDSDYSALDLVGATEGDRYRQGTEELQLLSPKNEKFEWMTGVYYYHQDGSTDRVVTIGSYGAVVGLPVNPNALTQTGIVRSESESLYSNATYHISSAFALSAGFRVETESKAANWSQVGPLARAVGLADGPYLNSVRANSFAPTVNLTYRVNKEVNTFFRYAEGTKSGGFNLDYINADLYPDRLYYKPETSRDIELGVKGDVRDVTFSLAIFYTNFSNYQLEQLQTVEGGEKDYVIGNVGAKTKGLEFDSSYTVTRFLSVNAGFSLLDASCSDCPGVGANGTDATGKKLPFAADAQAFANVVLENPLGVSNLRWRANINYTYVGPYFSTIDNLKSATISTGPIPFDYVHSRQLVNARLSILPAGESWEVALWGRNIFDQQYVYGYSSDFFGTLIVDRGAPRTFGVNLRVKF